MHNYLPGILHYLKNNFLDVCVTRRKCTCTNNPLLTHRAEIPPPAQPASSGDWRDGAPLRRHVAAISRNSPLGKTGLQSMSLTHERYEI